MNVSSVFHRITDFRYLEYTKLLSGHGVVFQSTTIQSLKWPWNSKFCLFVSVYLNMKEYVSHYYIKVLSQVTVNLCLDGRINHQLRGRSLGLSLETLLDQFKWGRKTCPACLRHIVWTGAWDRMKRRTQTLEQALALVSLCFLATA